MESQKYIQRCLQLAKNGVGMTRPNPSVGAVVVYNGHIIGEGFTSAYGKNHAEVNAIASVKEQSLLKKATLYVTLEPCSHHGKTPPCVDLIIKNRIKKVVIGCLDPNPMVAGKGVEKLKNTGISVQIGILAEQCATHHKRFFTFQNKKRPYLILKWAETTDGFIAPKTKNKQQPVWITTPYSRQLVHKWRSEEQAILVGTNTVISDNPTLNVRHWTGENPIAIIVDRSLKIIENSKVFSGDQKTIVFTQKMQSKNKNTSIETIDFSKNIAEQICERLYERQIQSVIIEGGLQTLQTFIDANLWDEARIFIGSIAFKKGIPAPNLSGKLLKEKAIFGDILRIYKNI